MTSATDRRPWIVVGIDGSAGAKHAFRWAADYARRTDGRLTAVIAWHYPPGPFGPGVIPPPPYDAQAAAAEVLADVVRAAGDMADDVEQVVTEGRPAGVLIDAARQADLLVVGSRGHGGFTGLLLGSVSTQCVHHAKCPVIIVRREED